jgi:protein-S-isoprenylcysteine O-methyltransferase Ste14
MASKADCRITFKQTSYCENSAALFCAPSSRCWAPMTAIITLSGFCIALALLALLALTYAMPSLAIWPTPGPGTWQSVLFWLLFRTSNIAALVLAANSLADPGRISFIDPAEPIKLLAAAIAAISIGLYALALFTLGRTNTYCGREGLMRSGIYRWTRNPQYATIIPFYAALAIAIDTPWLMVQTSLLVAIYVFMAINEEPWLRARYGADYDTYTKEVSRFFSFRRLAEVTRNSSRPFSAPRIPGPPR